MKQSEIKSKVTIICKDGTKRIVNVEGVHNQSWAETLGKDLEGNNYSSATIK